MRFAIVLLLWALGLAHAVANPTEIVAGPGQMRMRVDAVADGVTRIWIKPSGEFQRQPSLAIPMPPSPAGSLSRDEANGRVRITDAKTVVAIAPATMRFFVKENAIGRTPGTFSLLAMLGDAQVAAGVDGAWNMTAHIDPDSHLFGLGQDNHNNGRLDRRGVIRELWAGQQINSGNVTAEYPVPFLLSVDDGGDAFGLFFDNAHRLRFDLGKTSPDELRVDAAGGEIDFYVLAGPRPADVIKRFTALTGRPSLPPLWALGYWQSKCQYNDWNDVDEAYHQLTTRGFPVDAMVIDAGWPEVVTDYVWAKRWSAAETGHGKTPGQKVQEYAKKGVKIVMSQSGPMVRQDSPTYASGWAMGIFATDGKGNPVECGYYGGKLLDFTNPKLNDWLWPQTRKLNEAGTAAWWLDLTEPEGEPPQTHYYAGLPAENHNEFSYRCTLSFEGVQLAVHPELRPFILTRAGPAGLESHHAAVWSGDIYSDYATFRAHPPEMLNSGLSGFTYWTCDTGGFLAGYYKDDQMGAHARLYERWMEFSAFSPITRAHKAGGAPEPYQFGPAVEQTLKHYLQQRYRLLPYIYSYAWEASQTGLPIVRPLMLEYPDDPTAVSTPGDEYLFGRELLVAPVLHEGQSNRTVYFPKGNWFDWDTGVEYAGGREWVVAAPQNRIPVAVRAGAIIPMAPDMKNTAEKPWDPLTVEIFPEGESRFSMHADDGTTFAYRRGEYTTIDFTDREAPGRIAFALSESNKKFVPKSYVLRFHLRREPKSAVTDDNIPIAIKWDADSRVAEVTVASNSSPRRQIAILLGDAALPPRPAPELTADVIDPSGEATGSGGKPVPHFYPPPELPTTIKASNYDKGGEGVAFHTTRPLPTTKQYRDDDFGLAATDDVGGGYALSVLRFGEWARYTVDCRNGGTFDVSLRVASAAGGHVRLVAVDRTVVDAEVAPTGGAATFQTLKFPGIYLNPGELTLMVYADRGEVALNTMEFTRSAKQPDSIPAALATRGGVAELAGVGEAGHPDGYVRNLGRKGSSITLGIDGGSGGARVLRLNYASGQTRDVALSLKIGADPVTKVAAPSTKGEWRTLDLPVSLAPGTNRVMLAGEEENWESVQVDRMEVVSAGGGKP
ncbi:MAG TPA: TIM-barrel domain-containing protein [Candidatus Didemnitutus sp.]|nr:TIM-barrel domain-containing protein [Candidatus Didemnitutus sp.]